jgi:rod shape-determining protein MreC
MPSWVAFAVTLLAAVLVLRPEPARHFESVGTRVFEPVEFGVSGLISQVEEFGATLQKIADLARQNERYREQIDRLEVQLVEMAELKTENQDLRNLLRLRQRSGPGELIPVRKIGGDPNPFVGSFKIDKGEDDGVRSGMTVATSRGLVGRVVRSDPSTALVLQITDVNSAVTGRVQSTGATGVVRGRADQKLLADEPKLLMEKIPQEDMLEAGDLVVTSDLGGVFPERWCSPKCQTPDGLVIGRIIQVRRRDGDLFQEAVLEPAVEMSRLERLYAIGDSARPST